MKTAFELAIEFSYYVGELGDVATDPDVEAGRVVKSDGQIQIDHYGVPNDPKPLLTSDVPTQLIRILSQFALVSNIDGLSKNTLEDALARLDRTANLPDPAPGDCTHFSNLQRALREKLPEIKRMSDGVLTACP